MLHGVKIKFILILPVFHVLVELESQTKWVKIYIGLVPRYTIKLSSQQPKIVIFYKLKL